MRNSDRPTPIPIHVQKALANRVGQLEEEQGRMLREVAEFAPWRQGTERRIQGIEIFVSAGEDRESDEERTSRADLSLHPTRGRVSLKGLPSWAIAAIFIAAILATAVVLIVWLVK
jgi:hypothetical protein